MLNEKEVQILDYIKTCSEEDILPTVREICKKVGISSTSTACRYINKLVDMGLLEKDKGRNRSIRLPGGSGMRIPVMGLVTAGEPIMAVENISQYISINLERRHQYPLFALRVRGESMINAGIMDGSLVVVERTPTAENGDIVIVLLDNEEATCKRFFREKDHIRLQPENDFLKPICAAFERVEILGKVVASIQYF